MSQRVIVIGLDGATLDLILPWINQDLLPNFKRIVDRGVWGNLTSTIPPFTAPAWTSFMTGKNPGKHGIFDFMIRKPGSYSSLSINASFRGADSLWRIIGSSGKRVGVVNVPMTYPPEEVNGFLISGMLTPSQADFFTYPPSLSQEIRELFGNFPDLPLEVYHPRGREDQLVFAVERMTQSKIEVADYLMEKRDWDFFMIVFRGTDILQHWLWKFMDENHCLHREDSDSVLKEGILNIYIRLDSYLGKLLDKLGDSFLMIMSDHGAGPLEKYIYINTWLYSKGLIKLKKDIVSQTKRFLFHSGLTPLHAYDILMRLRMGRRVSKTVREHKRGIRHLMRKIFLSFEDIDWKRTVAYSLGNLGPIFINLKGREPEGIVTPRKEYNKLVQEIIVELSEMKDPESGERIIPQVYSREEIYKGKHLAEAPDIVFLPGHKYYALGQHNFPSSRWVERTRVKTGCHTMNGVMMMIGKGIKEGKEIKEARIIDLAPTILAAMRIPIPNDMDGEFLRDAFFEDFLKKNPVKYSEPRSKEGKRRVTFSEKEDLQIKDRLRGLGYI